MGKRGPAPKPTTLRLLDGAQPSKVNRNEPQARSGKIEPPDELSDGVRIIFEYVVAELEHMRIASPADVHSIVCYCEAVDKHRKASALLAKSSVLIKGLHGGMVRNPALSIQRDAANTIRQFAQEFGLTPSARARIDSDRLDDDFDNPFAASQ